TSPTACTPAPIAISASVTLAMQQILMRVMRTSWEIVDGQREPVELLRQPLGLQGKGRQLQGLQDFGMREGALARVPTMVVVAGAARRQGPFATGPAA
ncbi:MAG: hypothetical protein MUF21_14405, partial [Gemmatimonadaceae bacterium]|nr:hypothetical protein [Gemmatimonadaceae bacterium]